MESTDVCTKLHFHLFQSITAGDREGYMRCLLLRTKVTELFQALRVVPVKVILS